MVLERTSCQRGRDAFRLMATLLNALRLYQFISDSGKAAKQEWAVQAAPPNSALLRPGACGLTPASLLRAAQWRRCRLQAALWTPQQVSSLAIALPRLRAEPLAAGSAQLTVQTPGLVVSAGHWALLPASAEPAAAGGSTRGGAASLTPASEDPLSSENTGGHGGSEHPSDYSRSHSAVRHQGSSPSPSRCLSMHPPSAHPALAALAAEPPPAAAAALTAPATAGIRLGSMDLREELSSHIPESGTGTVSSAGHSREHGSSASAEGSTHQQGLGAAASLPRGEAASPAADNLQLGGMPEASGGSGTDSSGGGAGGALVPRLSVRQLLETREHGGQAAAPPAPSAPASALGSAVSPAVWCTVVMRPDVLTGPLYCMLLLRSCTCHLTHEPYADMH